MAKSKKIFMHIGVNCIIVLMLVSVAVLAFDNNIKSVFVPSIEGVYYKGDSEQNNVSLMVNVYWGNEYLESMLDTFDKFDVKTTFFVGGSWVSKYPELLLKIVARGHEIGNHGYFHKDHSKLNFEQNQQEIINTHKIVATYTNKTMTLFAPPSGAYNESTISASRALGYSTIMWSRDTIDWRDKDTEIIYSRATKNMANGDLILMHPTQNTMQALPRILEFCRDNDFNVAPVSQTIKFA